jgi:hypothetical protein
MKVLVTGRGGSTGSWAIRGEQIGRAIGATVEANANCVKGFDLAVVVKRPRADMLSRLRQRGVPVVWDVVDSWPQPDGNLWDRERCLGWLRREVYTVRPAAIVAATQAMAADCEEFGVPVMALPHHARPGIEMNPIRPAVRTVGYEGGEQYLGRWRETLERECARRGWAFTVNPCRLADVDIVVAVREQDGYAARHWKSGVKLANAQGSGTPCVLSRECGYAETACGAEAWADSAEEMSEALDALAPWQTRHSVSKALRSHRPGIDDLAKRYSSWLSSLRS